jgi:hypothetical protein
MLMLTQGTQTFDVEEEEEQKVLIPIEEGGANLSQTLDNPNPPKVDKKKVGYVIRGSNKRKALVVQCGFRKRKVIQGGNPENVNVQAMKEWEANEELIDHE